MKLPRLTLSARKNLKGYLYVSPFLIGFFAFFLVPLIQTIAFSLSELKIVPTGYTTTPVGLGNYNKVLFVDPDFVPTLTNTIVNTVIDIPAIVIFSFFIAVVLNQQFRGRALARLIFFLPVILTSGVVAQMELNDVMNQALVQEAEFMLGGQHFVRFLLGLNLPSAFIDYIVRVVDRIAPVIGERHTDSDIPGRPAVHSTRSVRGCRCRGHHRMGEVLDDHVPAGESDDPDERYFHNHQLVYIAPQRDGPLHRRERVEPRRLRGECGDGDHLFPGDNRDPGVGRSGHRQAGYA